MAWEKLGLSRATRLERLRVAAEVGDARRLAALLEAGADVDAVNETWLILAPLLFFHLLEVFCADEKCHKSCHNTCPESRHSRKFHAFGTRNADVSRSRNMARVRFSWLLWKVIWKPSRSAFRLTESESVGRWMEQIGLNGLDGPCLVGDFRTGFIYTT